MRLVSLTVDVERDCPPYLGGFRGVEEGLPRLLALLRDEGVEGTFFVTGTVARRDPGAVAGIVAAGHELGSHGDTHADLARLDRAGARREIRRGARAVRAFGEVTSFRAPYLRLPRRWLPLLEEAGFRLDSSQARYKLAYWRDRLAAGGAGDEAGPGGGVGRPGRRADLRSPNRGPPLRRVPASLTSSLLRLPRPLRDPLLLACPSPLVLFVHPWELVDLRREPIRLDCRFRTGEAACDALRSALRLLRDGGASFLPMRALP